ncbi:hypothetical protein QY96_01081 [Bacillus thermotolerans]|uniref:Uncharacterized protein n=1 Tax=Bacillus thermotolerans TaxID=1221996 RepID=A0A0F5HSH8_BACTR|nr:hypothetical protein QY95_03125 [Bacillus thermotolerans]KKB44800.1 hypothetical protein QY96_01081 [Bacillus thermotolerans]
MFLHGVLSLLNKTLRFTAFSHVSSLRRVSVDTKTSVSVVGYLKGERNIK